MKSIGTISAAIAVVVILTLVLGGCGIVGQKNGATVAENGIVAQYRSCAQVVDRAYNQIAATINLADAFYDQMKEVFVALASGDASGENFIVALQSNAVASGTDWAAVQLEAIRVTNAGLTDISVCQQTMADKQAAYASQLGWTIGAVGGGDGSFPQAWFADINNLPRQLVAGAADSPTRDRDGDGILTVFDYPAVVVTGLTRDAYENGELPPVPTTATATPQP